MKCYISVLLFSFSLSSYSIINPQLLMDENFSYIPGRLIETSGGLWFNSPAGTNDILVLEQNLDYPGYVSSGEGNYILLDGGSPGRAGVQRDFSQIITSSFYLSFLLQVKDTLDLNTYGALGESFLTLLNQLAQGRASVFIKKSFNQGNVRLGISKYSTVSYYPGDIPVNQTVLVVLRYRFAPGTGNDTLSLFINPPLSENEPSPDISVNAESDITNIAGLALRQKQYSGNIYADGIRASTSWGNAPLPVELSSFEAALKGDVVSLRWRTETEVRNYGFEVERQIRSRYRNEEWKRIGFVRGSGNSNSPKDYTFFDKDVSNFCFYYYRLRQIDNDGNFIYSDTIKTEIKIPGKFALLQNYPNPFNPVTVFRISIPADDIVRMKIYNAAGEAVIELINEYRAAGDYEIKFDGSDLPGGIYFCLLESGNQKKVIKTALVK